MLKLIALTVALAATAGVAGAQATGASTKTSMKASSSPKSGTPRRHRTAKNAETQAQLQAEAKVSMETARATALKEVPKGTIKSSELEREHGKLIYSFDINVPGKSGIEEINVNAIDGSVIAHEHESPKAEKKETAQETKEKKIKK